MSMEVGLISATKVSIEPIESAFQKETPDIELFHFLDSSLLPMLKEGGFYPIKSLNVLLGLLTLQWNLMLKWQYSLVLLLMS